jgi:hypothetical protein
MSLRAAFGVQLAAGLVSALAVGAANFGLMAVNTGRISWPLELQAAAAIALLCFAAFIIPRAVSVAKGRRLLALGLSLMVLMAVAWHIKTRVLASSSEAAEWVIFLASVSANIMATVGLGAMLLHSQVKADEIP